MIIICQGIKNNQPQTINEQITNSDDNQIKQKDPLVEKEDNNCPYLNEQKMTLLVNNEKTGVSESDLEKLKQIPQDYIIKLWKKGYHLWDIFKLWDWGLPNEDIPDLKFKKRIGVINELFVTFDFDLLVSPKEERKETKKDDIYVGGSKPLVVIVRKVPAGGKINIDKGYFSAPMTREEKQAGHYTKRVINFALKQENLDPQQHEIFLLSGLGREYLGKEYKAGFGKSGGKSAGSALYLALLSAIYQKPIDSKVASTGALSISTKRKKWGKVNGQEFQLVPGTNLPIGGLKHKISAAIEKGVDCFVLSKYQTSPYLLSEWQRGGKWTGSWDDNNNKVYTEEKWGKLSQDYQVVISSEIRKKLTVNFAENVKDLRELLLGGKLM